MIAKYEQEMKQSEEKNTEATEATKRRLYAKMSALKSRVKRK